MYSNCKDYLNIENRNFIQYILIEAITIQKKTLLNFHEENCQFSKYEIFWHNLSLYFDDESKDGFWKYATNYPNLEKLISILIENFAVFLTYLVDNYSTIKTEISNIKF